MASLCSTTTTARCPGTSGYDAGWTVNPESDEQLTAALEEIFSDPGAVRRKGKNAQRLVRERFTWDRTIEPLLDFLRHPSRASAVEPVPAPLPPPPAYLVPRGDAVDVPLVAPLTRIEQRFVVPADQVRHITVPGAFTDDGLRHLSRLTLSLRDASGGLRARRAYRAAELRAGASLRLVVPWYRPCRPEEGWYSPWRWRPGDGVPRCHHAGDRQSSPTKVPILPRGTGPHWPSTSYRSSAAPTVPSASPDVPGRSFVPARSGV